MSSLQDAWSGARAPRTGHAGRATAIGASPRVGSRGRPTLLALATALSLLWGVTAATADIVTVTYTGTVASGTDWLGLFGDPQADLNGVPYETVYRFDTSVGYRVSEPHRSFAVGGTVEGYPTPSLGAVMTINGVSVDIAGTNAGRIAGCDDDPSQCPGESYVYHDANDCDGSGCAGLKYVRHHVSSATGNLPASITTPFTHTFTGADVIWFDTDFYYRPGSDNYVWLYLAPSTVTVTSVSAVPEPSALLLLGTGLVGLGVTAWRRARRT